MEDDSRRRLLWHGFLILLVTLLLGLPTALGTHRKAWMAAHLTGFIGALLVMAVAYVWGELNLSAGQRKVVFRALLIGIYGNLLANVWGALVDFPGPATRPDVTAPRWELIAFSAMAAVFVPSLFTTVVLILHGLRRPARQTPAAPLASPSSATGM